MKTGIFSPSHKILELVKAIPFFKNVNKILTVVSSTKQFIRADQNFNLTIKTSKTETKRTRHV